MISKAIQTADLDAASALEALRRFNTNCLEHRELTVLFMHHEKGDALSSLAIADWEKQIDAFFLRGQQEGVFRIDIAAPELQSMWISLLLGLIDVEARGRIAQTSMLSVLERAFLNGVLA